MPRREWKVSVHAGAGIVADSDLEKECVKTSDARCRRQTLQKRCLFRGRREPESHDWHTAVNVSWAGMQGEQPGGAGVIVAHLDLKSIRSA
jgi:hypothetical protein